MIGLAVAVVAAAMAACERRCRGAAIHHAHASLALSHRSMRHSRYRRDSSLQLAASDAWLLRQARYSCASCVSGGGGAGGARQNGMVFACCLLQRRASLRSGGDRATSQARNARRDLSSTSAVRSDNISRSHSFVQDHQSSFYHILPDLPPLPYLLALAKVIERENALFGRPCGCPSGSSERSAHGGESIAVWNETNKGQPGRGA